MLAASEVHLVDTKLGTLELLLLAHAGKHHERELHIVDHRLAVKQGCALKEHAYLLACLLELRTTHLGDVAAVVENLAVLGLEQAHQVFYQHRLARARLAYYQVHLAVVESGVDVVQHLASAVVKIFVKMLYFNHNIVVSSSTLLV